MALMLCSQSEKNYLKKFYCADYCTIKYNALFEDIII